MDDTKIQTGECRTELPDDMDKWPAHIRESYEKLCEACDDLVIKQQLQFVNAFNKDCPFLKHIGVESVDELDKLDISVTFLQFLIPKLGQDFFTNIHPKTKNWILDKLDVPIQKYKDREFEINETISKLFVEKAKINAELKPIMELYQSVEGNVHPLEQKLLMRDYKYPRQNLYKPSPK